LDCETGSPGAGHAIGDDLSELPFALGVTAFQFLRADECARSLMSLEQTAEFQFTVSAHDRIWIYRQVNCQLAHRRQLVAGNERTRGHCTTHLVHDLPIDRYAAVRLKSESGAVGSRAHFMLQCTI